MGIQFYMFNTFMDSGSHYKENIEHSSTLKNSGAPTVAQWVKDLTAVALVTVEA